MKHYASNNKEAHAKTRVNMSPDLFRRLLEVVHTTGIPPMLALQLVQATATKDN